jgi:hypothetical protein
MTASESEVVLVVASVAAMDHQPADAPVDDLATGSPLAAMPVS